jgi:spore coat protein H
LIKIGRLWDHNMSMMAGGHGGFGRGVSLDKAEITENWPLIRYLLDEPIYYDLHVCYVEETATTIFAPEKMAETYSALAEIIAPYATAENGDAAFEAAVQQLIDHAYARAEAVELFLAEQP